MSARPTPSPRLPPTTQVDESQLPKGQCRYILLLPEIKGQRCACVNFTLNKAMPSAACDCGHLACFHVKEPEKPHSKEEMDALRQRISALEEQLTLEREDAPGSLVTRLSEVEERLDKSREEFGEQIKGAYRNITRSWSSITELERRDRQFEERLQHVDAHLNGVDAELRRLGDRQMELVDADITLEERIENLVDTLEEAEEQGQPLGRRPRRRSTSDSTHNQDHPLGGTPRPRQSSANRSIPQRPRSLLDASGAQVSPTGPTSAPFRPPLTCTSSGIWTVHVSLLPSASQPFPFERNTNAYQRCLSRGLHRTVAIRGTDSDSFVTAVSDAFEGLLKGRPWMPLQAKLCDVEQLQGLPMLRQLDPALVDSSRYDADFLRENCAVCDPTGKIDSLYIAMRSDTLSWHALRHAPVWMDGLEASWTHDPMFDQGPGHPFFDDGDDDAEDDDAHRPAAGDIVSTFPSLKRAASEMSRSASFGAATAPTIEPGEGPSTRAKRACPVPVPATIVEIRRRGVKTV